MDAKRVCSMIQHWINEEPDVSIEMARDYVYTLMSKRYACDPLRVSTSRVGL